MNEIWKEAVDMNKICKDAAKDYWNLDPSFREASSFADTLACPSTKSDLKQGLGYKQLCSEMFFSRLISSRNSYKETTALLCNSRCHCDSDCGKFHPCGIPFATLHPLITLNLESRVT